MDQIYNNKMRDLGYPEFVCDIFSKWEDVKDELLVPDRKSGTGNGTIHVFLGAADHELRKEFSEYYSAVESGEDPAVHAVKVEHFFLSSNIVSLIGHLCLYDLNRKISFTNDVQDILDYLNAYRPKTGLLQTSSLLKLSTGSSKLRPYFKQFESTGVFSKLVRKILLPNSSYKISLYKNSAGGYAAFWLIGFDWQTDFEADSSADKFSKNTSIDIDTNPLQQIFYGAPGTGKSYTINNDTKGEDVLRTTFHPDSDYSSFVGAYKPTTKEETVMTVIGTKAVTVENADGTPRKASKIVYEFVAQAFLQAYVAAWKKYAAAGDAEPKKQYLVIEEINRGNCAQIFGDLFQLLDRNDSGFSDYPIKADADMKQQLAKAFAGISIAQADSINALYDNRDVVTEVLNGDILLLPNNLCLWATMNTSDQSLFPIDSAFKRRWDWNYVPISDAKLSWVIDIDGVKYDWWQFLTKINEKIGSTTNSEDKKLGYFFCKAKDGVISAETFVGKVVFYLWNDVFKDFDFSDGIFRDEDGSNLSFAKFYTEEDKHAKVKTDKVAVFLGNLGLGPISIAAADDQEEYDGQKESTEDLVDSKGEWSPIERKRYEFWDSFLTYAQKNKEFNKYFGGVKKPSKDHWKNFFISGVDFYLCAIQQRRKNAVELQVYFDKTNDTYHRLFSHKDAIEHEMGVKYEWRENPEKKSSIISERKYSIDFEDTDSWKTIFDFIIGRLLRMREVFVKYSEQK